MKNRYLYGAVLLGVLGLFAFIVFVNSRLFFSNNGENQVAAVSLAQSSGYISDFSIELNMEDQIEVLKHPQKFFSGRELKIIRKSPKLTQKKSTDKQEPKAILVSDVNLSMVGNTKIKSNIKETRLATEVEEGVSIIKLPTEIITGSYKLSFLYGSNRVSLPIEIIGSDVNKETPLSRQLYPPPRDLKIYDINLGCGWCFWELSSGINPTNENYGYVAGGGASDYLVHTTNAWASSTIDHIDQIVTPLLQQYRYRGDPYLTFDANNKLSIVSLFSTWGDPEMITGGIYKEKTPKDNPLQLSQIIVKTAPPTVPPGTWIVFDYPKLSIDTSSTSPRKGNMYVFANAVLSSDGIHSGQGQFVVSPAGVITEKIATYGFAVTATAVGPQGDVYAVMPGGAATEGYYITRSFDGGNTFSQKLIVPHASQIWCAPKLSTLSQRAAPFYIGPDIAVDKNSGRIYVAWSEPTACLPDQNFEYSQYGFDFNVYLSYSDDRGETWSVPVQVDDDLSQGNQSFPSITVGDNGDVYVAFVDHRNNQDRPWFDIYLSKSTNHGRTFSQNLQVNNISVPNIYGGVRAIGDYLRMVSVGEKNINVAYPCVSKSYPSNEYPSDACVSVVSKSSWYPPIGRPPRPSQCEHFAPNVTPSGYPSAIVTGDSGYMSIRISNQDYAGCDSSNFDIIAVSPPSWQFTFYPTDNLTLRPGAWGYKDVNIGVPAEVVPGNYTMIFDVTNKNNGLKKTINVPIQVIVPVAITNIVPAYGPKGTNVTITGTSFAPNNNWVSMSGISVSGGSGSQQIPSYDGRIYYAIPSTITTCDVSCRDIPTPDGDYTISVFANNSTASIGFHVGTSSPVLPTASIIGTPTLIMDYISPSEEGALISTFRVAINAGSSDQKIAKDYAFWSYARTDSGMNMSGAMRYAQPSGTTDNGNGFYIIPANTTATFAVQTTFNPKQMFAGAYYGVLSQVRLGDYSNPNYINFSPPNTTNTLVIIGEVSPYINSISPNPVSPGSALTINGVRFGINVTDTVNVYLKGGGSVKQYFVQSSDGLTIRFTPKGISGGYVLQIVHPKTGASNMVYLTLGDSPPEQPPAPASTIPSLESVGGGGGGGGGTPAPQPTPVEPPVIKPTPADLETSFLGQFVASVLNGFNLLFKH